MLQSEKIERERRFKLALRAGLPVLILSGLIGYNMVFKPTLTETISANIFLLIAILFIGIYFIYFMIELASSENIIDNHTKLFTEQAFQKRLADFNPEFLTILSVQNIDTIDEQQGTVAREKAIALLSQTLSIFIEQDVAKSNMISRINNGELMIAVRGNSKIGISKCMQQFIKKNKKINNIDIKYSSATSEYHDTYDKTLMYLRILLQIADGSSTNPQNSEDRVKKIDLNINDIDIDSISKNTISALEDKNLLFTYRPLLNLKNNTIEIYEAFAKLKTNDASEILPKMYLPILNRLGLSKEYDTAIAQHIINLLQQTESNISFEFNISPFSMRDQQFQKQFIKMLKISKVDPSRLIIQLYENKAHHDISSYLKTLELYRKKGVRICIDNFGLSSASMEYMKHFKFDMIQLDRDFITNIGNTQSKTMLNAILEISSENNLISVAKWVDKPEQKEALKDLGINYIQGFMVHKPLFESEIITKHGIKGI